jgi:hypothetical protein
MALKFRYADLLTGTSHVGGGAVSGEARANIGLGAVFGKVLAFEFKGDDANVDTDNTLELKDADGRTLLTAIALDAGGTTTDQYTQQETAIGTTVAAVSTVGVRKDLVYLEADAVGADGVATTDNVGAGSGGVYAKSPVTVTIVAGTDGDWQRVGLWVEV